MKKYLAIAIGVIAAIGILIIVANGCNKEKKNDGSLPAAETVKKPTRIIVDSPKSESPQNINNTSVGDVVVGLTMEKNINL